MKANEMIAHLVDALGEYLPTLTHDGKAAVLDGFGRWRHGETTPVEPRWLPPVDLLPDAVKAAGDGAQGTVARAILAAAPHLHWITYDGYSRAAIGEAFADGHAFATVIGPTGPIVAEGFELGLFIIKPGVFYRDHRHGAPELYATLTGPHGFRFEPGGALGWEPAGAPVWNTALRPHAIKVGRVPFLCAYVWTDDIEAPSEILHADDWQAMQDLLLPDVG